MSTENFESDVEITAEEPQLVVEQGPGPVRRPQHQVVVLGHCGRLLYTYEMVR